MRLETPVLLYGGTCSIYPPPYFCGPWATTLNTVYDTCSQCPTPYRQKEKKSCTSLDFLLIDPLKLRCLEETLEELIIVGWAH